MRTVAEAFAFVLRPRPGDLFGIPLGLLLGWYVPLRNFLNPLLEIFHNAAPLALLPVFSLLPGLVPAIW